MTIYVIAEGRIREDYYGRDEIEFEIDEAYGYFESYENAQRFCEEKDHGRHQWSYDRYVEKLKRTNDIGRAEVERLKAGKLTKAEREHEALVKAGLREPKKPQLQYTDKAILTYDEFVEKGRGNGLKWKPHFEVRELKPGKA